MFLYCPYWFKNAMVSNLRFKIWSNMSTYFSGIRTILRPWQFLQLPLNLNSLQRSQVISSPFTFAGVDYKFYMKSDNAYLVCFTQTSAMVAINSFFRLSISYDKRHLFSLFCSFGRELADNICFWYLFKVVFIGVQLLVT